MSPTPEEPVRLVKQVAALAGCSRREAELYIEGGWVRVDGKVVDVPGAKFQHGTVTLDPNAKAEPVAEVTLLLHKPAGFEAWDDGRKPALQLLVPANHLPGDRSGIRPVKRHFEQFSLTPLETAATGLLVFSQDWRVKRKLVEDAAQVEHELSVDVEGEVTPAVLHQLNRAPVIDGRAMAPAKVSIGRQNEKITGLRIASKGHWPGRIAQMCDTAGLRIVSMKRIRVGRIALAGLEPGQWRYLMPYERF